MPAILPAGPLTRLDPHRYRPSTASTLRPEYAGERSEADDHHRRSAPSSARGPNQALTGSGSSSGTRRARSTRPVDQPPSGDTPLTVSVSGAAVAAPSAVAGIILRATSGFYSVLTDDGRLLQAQLRGLLKKERQA